MKTKYLVHLEKEYDDDLRRAKQYLTDLETQAYQLTESVYKAYKERYEENLERAEKYKREFLECKAKAFAGDPEAQVDLGNEIHRIGDRDSWIEGVQWYEKAAEQSYAEAWNQLAWCYRYDEGKRGSYDNALVCYRKAVELGDTEALYCIAFVYECIAESFEEILSKADWGIEPMIKMKIYESYVLALYWSYHAIDVQYNGKQVNLKEPSTNANSLDVLYQQMLKWDINILHPEASELEEKDFKALQYKIKEWHYTAIEDDWY